MANRITIYLPDEVAEALDKVKDKINVSRVCASAVQQEIQRMQMLELGKTDRQTLIARLRAEKMAAHEADEQAGREQAASDVTSMDYTELVTIAEISLHENYIDSNVYWSFLPEWVQDDLRANPEYLAGVDSEAWAYGWLSYVQKFWEDIKREL